jgi:hypothetical protein
MANYKTPQRLQLTSAGTTIAGKPVFISDRIPLEDDPYLTPTPSPPADPHSLHYSGYGQVSAGDACVFSCTYCYVEGQTRCQLERVDSPAPIDAPLSSIVIRRKDAATRLVEHLQHHPLRDLNRTVFISRTVDPAPTVHLADETSAMVLALLSATAWTVRLLSKSPLLGRIGDAIGLAHRDRVIFGFSTGTLDDRLAACVEVGAPPVSKRLESLRRLQDRGFRTYAMISPSLPQDDYDSFVQIAVNAVNLPSCELFCAEQINFHGIDPSRTTTALAAGGWKTQANLLEDLAHNAALYDEHARRLYEAYSRVIPRKQLRFLYRPLTPAGPWWRDRFADGIFVIDS